MNKFNGLLLVHKPSGITSHDVVGRVRRILQTREVGHCGTLDPLASGLMVLLINEATKLSQYILEQDKEYIVTARFGLQTDTLDITGKVTEERPLNWPVSEASQLKAHFDQAAQTLTGEQMLKIPKFSAVKIDGKKLYEYARQQQEIEVPTRAMTFYEAELLECAPQAAQFRIHCSKGSYIRSWVQSLGEKLGPGATMSALVRTHSRPYHLKNAINLDALDEMMKSSAESETYAAPCFIPMGAVLPETKYLRVKGQSQVLLTNGQISHDLRRQLISVFQPERDQVVKILSTETDQLLALVGLEKNKGFVIKRVFRY